MLSFFNKSDEESAILIDIGNGTITGSLTIFKKQDKPRFIYITKKFFATNEKLEAEQLEIEMNNLLEEVMSSIMSRGFESKYWQEKKKKIDRVLISFSSPWFMSKTKTINLVNDKEFVITNAFLEDILTKEMKALKVELDSGDSHNSYEVIERSIVHSKINGYVLDEAIGKTTKKFDAALYMSVVSSSFLNKVLSLIHKHTHIDDKKISINSFPLISFTVIRDLFTKESNFILIDVTGEITDITLVKSEIIEKTVSIPSGKNFIVRQIAKKFNVPTEIAESSLQLYITKKVDDDSMSKISDVLVDVEKEWSIYLENALTELSQEEALPSSVYLTSDSEIANIYIDFLSIQKQDSTTAFRKNVKINEIDLEKMKSFYTNESGFVLDEFIVMLSLFYKKIINF